MMIWISLISIPCYLSGIFIVRGIDWWEGRHGYERYY